MYEYQCANGHVTDIHSTMEEKPREVECRACGQPAEPVISFPQRPIIKSGTPLHHGTRGVK